MKCCCTLLLICAALLCAVDAWPTQPPFWPLYPTRDIQVLDGEWEFGYVENWKYDVTSNSTDVRSINTPNTTIVPSSFDYRPPGFEGPRGTAFYRTHVNITADAEVVLIYFAACGFYCHVFVDGDSIGDHKAGGYAPFWLTVPSSSNGVREIFVIVDNRFNETTAPVHTGGDFYHFGGIHRSVVVHVLSSQPNDYLDHIEILPQDYTKGIINLNVMLSGSVTEKVTIEITWDDQSSISLSGNAVDGLVTFTQLQVPNPKPWTLSSPFLHNMTVSLIENNDAVDAIQARFGLRVLGQDKNSRITINGEVVKLHGFNRHTMYADVGPAMTLEQIQGDIQMLQDVGANYVRGSHYPQDQRFLDLCDEVGIVIWEEALGPGVSTANTENPYFMHYQLQQMNEMISASFNHPSVIFWGFFNEGPADDAASCPGYKACASLANQRDPTRYATWANNHALDDKCLDYANVISFNSYPGWYDHAGNVTYAHSYWNSLLDQAAQQYKQAITVSETGGEGLWEWPHNGSTVIWGQEYQVNLLQTEIMTILGNPRVSGLTLWVMNDFKGNDGAQFECGPCSYYPNTTNAVYVNYTCDGKCGLGCRPCGENHKGTYDYWRRPKEVYTNVKTLYHQQWP